MNWRELKTGENGGSKEVKNPPFSSAGVRVKRQEMGKRRKNERKEVAVGLLKVLKDKSMKGGSMLIGLI